MKRREFIKKAGLATAGAISVPFILPSGRLFAATGKQMAEHVVVVMFAGGVRQEESVLQRYLDGSQVGEPYPGNIMNNMLNGAPPTQKIVYGTGEGGINPIPQILNTTLQSQGTLFPEVRAISYGHFGGLNSMVQGANVFTQGLKNRPVHPTIFEYLRRHGGYKATDTWFIGNGIGNSVPLLTYSVEEGYGSQYGANFFAPNITFGNSGQEFLGDAKIYHPENELDPIYKMKVFLDNNFENYANGLANIGNTDDEKQQIKEFMINMFEKTQNGTIAHPPIHNNGDTSTIGYAAEVLSEFKPACLFVNLNDVDVAHSDFTGYVSALHRADHAVGHLWNHIQSIPEMANNTTIICTPECGRNSEPNAILDINDWRAYGHSDENSLRVFSLMAGPDIPSNNIVGGVDNPVGLISDTMLTVADILGVKQDVYSAGYLAPLTSSLFDHL